MGNGLKSVNIQGMSGEKSNEVQFDELYNKELNFL